MREKKDQIRKLTEDIIGLTENSKKNKVKIKKNVTGILSLFSVIDSYIGSTKIDMLALIQFAELIFDLLNNKDMPIVTTTYLEFFCNIANTIKFSFTGRGLKVNIQKIDPSIFRTGK